MNKVIKIYHGECEHLFINSNSVEFSCCSKRYYEIFPIDSDPIYLVICNEYLRNKLNENRYSKKQNGNVYRDVYIRTVEEIIDEHIPDKYSYQWKYNDKISPITGLPIPENKVNPWFCYEICKRPYIVRTIKLSDAISLLLDHENWHDWDRKIELNDHFVHRVYDQINQIARYFDKYNLYKKEKERIATLLKYMDGYHHHDTKNSDRIREIIIIFFEIQCKIKKAKL